MATVILLNKLVRKRISNSKELMTGVLSLELKLN